jgi:hypothetical protein
VYRVEVKRDALIATLLDAGRITEAEALDVGMVEAAAGGGCPRLDAPLVARKARKVRRIYRRI